MARPTILISPRFQAALKNLSDTDLARTEETLQILPECFGQPHVHAGISIRRLRKNLYECRAGLKMRVLFRAGDQFLEVIFVGNHGDVRHLIRDL